MLSFSKALFLAGLCAVDAIAIPKNLKGDLYDIGTQEHLFPLLAGSGPYFSHPEDYGIPIDPPAGCEISQIQLLARHGERYPTKSKAAKLFKTWDKILNYPRNLNGSLSFVDEDYEFFIQDISNLEQETTLENSVNAINPYTGEMDAKKHAQEFLAQYGDFLEDNREFAVFAASSKRVHDTAQYFIHSLGDKFNISLNVVSEDPSSGANTLSPGYSCPAWNPDENDDILGNFSTDYLKELATRLNGENHGLNLTTKDAYNLFDWCAYELNARGYSEICNVFTPEELIHYSYYNDLVAYYQDGPGYPMIQAVGALYFNASIKLLQQSEQLDQKVWLSFTHDTDILNYLTTVGLFDNGKDLDPSRIPFTDQVFHKSWMIPQGARVYTQKYQCSNDFFIRYVVNDAVIPLQNCSDGPGFSCEAKKFYEYADQRVASQDFFEVCNVSSVSNTTQLTFFWDWNTTHYNATLLDE
ncbi:histidine phosphatase family protein LALA0_S15e01552g [Lachancea lanzarotensis]|uniref:acid phosphatase n=1 Tax=Lachancea lanzarotensis TaxID=1245769 RepID=A0A0C7MYA7_9SACH|nr:uncharacterized protein LALA0_S15e01552g [Lachancea lanzarotensis]CEP64973.1 LALA0S15e01552g1_1 [Lachancea lanzarotensis]